jgi:hypothetical protein
MAQLRGGAGDTNSQSLPVAKVDHDAIEFGPIASAEPTPDEKKPMSADAWANTVPHYPVKGGGEQQEEGREATVQAQTVKTGYSTKSAEYAREANQSSATAMPSNEERVDNGHANRVPSENVQASSVSSENVANNAHAQNSPADDVSRQNVQLSDSAVPSTSRPTIQESAPTSYASAQLEPTSAGTHDSAANTTQRTVSIDPSIQRQSNNVAPSNSIAYQSSISSPPSIESGETRSAPPSLAPPQFVGPAEPVSSAPAQSAGAPESLPPAANKLAPIERSSTPALNNRAEQAPTVVTANVGKDLPNVSSPCAGAAQRAQNETTVRAIRPADQCETPIKSSDAVSNISAHKDAPIQSPLSDRTCNVRSAQQSAGGSRGGAGSDSVALVENISDRMGGSRSEWVSSVPSKSVTTKADPGSRPMGETSRGASGDSQPATIGAKSGLSDRQVATERIQNANGGTEISIAGQTKTKAQDNTKEPTVRQISDDKPLRGNAKSDRKPSATSDTTVSDRPDSAEVHAVRQAATETSMSTTGKASSWTPANAQIKVDGVKNSNSTPDGPTTWGAILPDTRGARAVDPVREGSSKTGAISRLSDLFGKSDRHSNSNGDSKIGQSVLLVFNPFLVAASQLLRGIEDVASRLSFSLIRPRFEESTREAHSHRGIQIGNAKSDVEYVNATRTRANDTRSGDLVISQKNTSNPTKRFDTAETVRDVGCLTQTSRHSSTEPPKRAIQIKIAECDMFAGEPRLKPHPLGCDRLGTIEKNAPSHKLDQGFNQLQHGYVRAGVDRNVESKSLNAILPIIAIDASKAPSSNVGSDKPQLELFSWEKRPEAKKSSEAAVENIKSPTPCTSGSSPSQSVAPAQSLAIAVHDEYIVEEPETLQSIAKNRMGDENLVDLIFELNKGVLQTLHSWPLRVGTRLLLPTEQEVNLFLFIRKRAAA